jgi:hypothetical protein
MIHLISSEADLWQSGAMVPGRSDSKRKNTTNVRTPLTEGCFMDLDFRLWDMGVWSATMSRWQRTIEKILLVCNCWDVVPFEPLACT